MYYSKSNPLTIETPDLPQKPNTKSQKKWLLLSVKLVYNTSTHTWNWACDRMDGSNPLLEHTFWKPLHILPDETGRTWERPWLQSKSKYSYNTYDIVLFPTHCASAFQVHSQKQKQTKAIRDANKEKKNINKGKNKTDVNAGKTDGSATVDKCNMPTVSFSIPMRSGMYTESSARFLRYHRWDNELKVLREGNIQGLCPV